MKRKAQEKEEEHERIYEEKIDTLKIKITRVRDNIENIKRGMQKI